MVEVRVLKAAGGDSGVLPPEVRRVAPAAPQAEAACREVIAAIEREGDAAILEFTRRFDGVDLSQRGLRVAEHEFVEAEKSLDPQVRDALAHAIRNIRRVHEQQMPPPLAMLEVEPGVFCGDRVTPIDSVCLYVPRGRGAFSSVMCMLGVPARVAGVPRTVVCTPPGPNGDVDAATLVAARLIGINEIYHVGGAQAVAAVAFGTSTIPRCDKFVGPGNVYVSAARQLLRERIDPGPPAGPSESAILCDGSALAENAAWNLLIEAEHGENSCAILVTHDAEYGRNVAEIAAKFADDLPPQRRDFVSQVLGRNGGVILTDSLETSIRVVNEFAPEHLAVMVANPWSVLERMRHAGEILVGDFPIISLGNYAMGLNAILPTGAAARTRSCVTVHEFLKRSSVGYVTRKGYESLRPVVSALSRDEGFAAHHLAVERWM